MNYMEFVKHVENTLGWVPPEGTWPRWKTLTLEAAKLKRKMATNPRLYTWDHMLLAVEMLRRSGTQVASPAAVCWHVRRALAAEGEREDTGDIAAKVHLAISEAFMAGESEWVERLARARGDARKEVLEEWNAIRVDSQKVQ